LRSDAASLGYRRAGFVLRRWMIWLLVPVYALVFGEAFVRLLDPVPVMPRYVTGAPYGVRVGMPNMRFVQTTPETRAEIRTNARGMRADRNIPYAKPPGTCRIVLLGDSLLVGYEVDLEDSFAYLLESRLRAGGYRCEVVNLAVSGFGTAEMLVTLRAEGLKYHPDLVVFSSHTTDLDDNVRASLYRLDGQGHLVRDKPAFLPGIELSDRLSAIAPYRWLIENSQLYSALRERASRSIKSAMVNFRRPQDDGARDQPDDSGAPPGRADDYPWRLTLALLEESRAAADAAGARYSVLELPASITRTQIERRMPEYPAGEAEALHVASPLGALLAAAGPDRKLFFEKGHGHLTPEGNRVVTDYFYGQLVRNGWLEAWRKPAEAARSAPSATSARRTPGGEARS
jgi:hypothetical protein